MAANTMGAVQARSFFSLMFIPEPPANNKNGETRDPRQRRPTPYRWDIENGLRKSDISMRA
jgi:hypothetical protein